MNKLTLTLLSAMAAHSTFAQWGYNDSRTETRDDAGLQGNAGAKSGFYQTVAPVNYPAGASSYWHLLDVRHDNPANNYAMQFAGSFFNQELYFRKTNNDPASPWSKVLLERGNVVGVGSVNPVYFTDSWRGFPDQAPNYSEISNDVNQFKSLMLVGNKSAGGQRRIGMWDQLSIGGAGYYQALNVQGGGYFTGKTGIGIGSPRGILHVYHAGASVNISSDISNSMVVEGSASGRSATTGAQLEFVIPANTDGSNPWGQARIITVAGNANNGDATGKMIIGTRRTYDKVGTGTTWYYGDDITIDGSGNVGVNTLDTKGYKFAVNGTAAFAKIVVKNPGNWPDYVFDSAYQLPSLQQLGAFVKSNKHLPGIPSAEEMQKSGMDVGEICRLQQEKIEELTLYLLQQQQTQDELKQRLEKQEQLLQTIMQQLKNK